LLKKIREPRKIFVRVAGWGEVLSEPGTLTVNRSGVQAAAWADHEISNERAFVGYVWAPLRNWYNLARL